MTELDFDLSDKKDLSIVLGSRGITLFDLVKRYSHFVTDKVSKDADYFISVKAPDGKDFSEKFL